jgi:adenylate cyclase
MAGGEYARRLAAIVSADVAGYSRLMEDDEAATVGTLTGHLAAMTEIVVAHRGRVVDAPGDNLLAEFPSVVDALTCAVALQEMLATRNEPLPEGRRMRFRIGVNLGDVIAEGDKIYGDGINIAARLEALAEPGGICVSGTVYEHVRSKLELGFEHCGEQRVKNITNPVQVYRVVSDLSTPRIVPSVTRRPWRARLGVAAAFVVIAGALVAGGVMLLGGDETAPTTAVMPTLAVLPFDNMSADPDQEYFSDGITEDLITDLAKVSGLHVIARNSVFVYKGQAVDVGQVAADLGVRYVLEGSVRRDAGTIRVNAQLIDSTTGGHVWAERYDRDLADVFAIQDEVVAEIVQALAIVLTDEEEDLLEANPTEDLEAYDLAKRANWFYNQYTPEANAQAAELYRRAGDADPEYSLAYSGLGATYYEGWVQQWSDDPQALDRAMELATQALDLYANDIQAHSVLAHVHLWNGRHDEAIAVLERAIAIQPSNASSYRDLAEVEIFAGESENALALLDTAVGLDPNYGAVVPFTFAFAHTMLGQYDAAITHAREAIALNPNFTATYMVLIIVYAEQNLDELAAEQLALLLDINPGLSLEMFAARLPFKDSTMAEVFLSALEVAGLD